MFCSMFGVVEVIGNSFQFMTNMFSINGSCLRLLPSIFVDIKQFKHIT